MIESHAKLVKIGTVLGFYIGNQLFRGNTFPISSEHDRGAVGVVSANIVALMATHLLEAYPDIGLNIFDKMTQMDRAVGIR
jgi:hypothetical protein